MCYKYPSTFCQRATKKAVFQDILPYIGVYSRERIVQENDVRLGISCTSQGYAGLVRFIRVVPYSRIMENANLLTTYGG